jgi:hypothetical protein
MEVYIVFVFDPKEFEKSNRNICDFLNIKGNFTKGQNYHSYKILIEEPKDEGVWIYTGVNKCSYCQDQCQKKISKRKYRTYR